MNFRAAVENTRPSPQAAIAREARIQTALDALSIRGFEDDSEPVLDDAWLVEDLIPDAGLGVVYGSPGCGKSFFVLDIALSVAGAQTRWRDKYIEHGPVLYLGMEGGRLFQNRTSAYHKHFGTSAPHFYRSPVTVNLRSSNEDFERLKAAASAIAERAGQGLKLLVVDTLNRAMAGGNENSPEDMGAFVASCDALAKSLGCYVLIVHHSGKDAARGARGHSSLFGAIDTEIEIADRVATNSKQRDGKDGEKYGFELAVVELGRSPRGKVITSCVVEPAEVASAGPRLSPAQQQAHDDLCSLVVDHGVACPGGDGWPEAGAHRIVALDAFKAALVKRQTHDEPKKRNQAVKRLIDALVDKRCAAVNEDFIWPL